MKHETLKNILINRGRTLYRKFHPEKRPECLLHHKPWSEMSLWEKRMYGGKDGKPIPIKTFTKEFSHEECEKALQDAFRLGFWGKISSYFDF